uniref:Ribosomal protein L13 n=1 Tax=Sciadococcus taiwanensis TaxID=3028030 RepID=A0A9Y1I2A9_9RHOD|nr:ribosomal protein L13 [Sciadococcus taiwanensis]
MNKTSLTSYANANNMRKWYLINAQDKTLGRLSTRVAHLLQGKNKINYSPYLNTGDFVIIINAEKIKVSGNKKEKKFYFKHSGKPGSMKIENFTQLQQRIPSRIIENSVKGMLPKNSLGKKMFKGLKIYSGIEHPHTAQHPKELNI